MSAAREEIRRREALILTLEHLDPTITVGAVRALGSARSAAEWLVMPVYDFRDAIAVEASRTPADREEVFGTLAYIEARLHPVSEPAAKPQSAGFDQIK